MEKINIRLSEIIKKFKLEVVCGQEYLDREIKGGYVSDLLSDVIANSSAGDIWITLQGHPNIIAVAVLNELAGIIIINGHKPDEETIRKAVAEKLPVIISDLPAYELVGRLYEFGIPGLR